MQLRHYPVGEDKSEHEDKRGRPHHRRGEPLDPRVHDEDHCEQRGLYERARDLDRLEHSESLRALEHREQRARREVEEQLCGDEREREPGRIVQVPLDREHLDEHAREQHEDGCEDERHGPEEGRRRGRRAVHGGDVVLGPRFGDVAGRRALHAEVGERRVAAEEGERERQHEDAVGVEPEPVDQERRHDERDQDGEKLACPVGQRVANDASARALLRHRGSGWGASRLSRGGG